MESGLPKFNVGKTQMTNILKGKAEIINDIENNAPSDSKRKRQKTGNEDINDLCWKWFQDAVGRLLNVTGPLLKMKALKFAKDLGNQNFKASNGWLASFTKRHNVVFGTHSGERGDVDNDLVQSWMERISDLIKEYEPENIFNMDKTGLFFRNRQLKKMVREMDHSSKCGSEILKNISLLDAIYWIDRSWKEVETSTIVKCFKRCGFVDMQNENLPTTEVDVNDGGDDDEDEDDDVPLAVLQLSRELFGCEFRELVKMDADMETCDNQERDWDKPASEIIEEMNEKEDEDYEEEESEECESVICREKFCKNLAEMKICSKFMLKY
uniref:HTH CENPB-type domain-containing protein n=1 Tax=Magallana gigas TaxID=29159 RepID=A0A8W8I2G5_MAGGI